MGALGDRSSCLEIETNMDTKNRNDGHQKIHLHPPA
jgi:hypothetical protein